MSAAGPATFAATPPVGTARRSSAIDAGPRCSLARRLSAVADAVANEVGWTLTCWTLRTKAAIAAGAEPRALDNAHRKVVHLRQGELSDGQDGLANHHVQMQTLWCVDQAKQP